MYIMPSTSHIYNLNAIHKSYIQKEAIHKSYIQKEAIHKSYKQNEAISMFKKASHLHV